MEYSLVSKYDMVQNLKADLDTQDRK